MENSDQEISSILTKIKRYLPNQAPLKDFVFLNTLACFQDRKFHQAMHEASSIFGVRTYYTIEDFRRLFKEGQIKSEILEKVLSNRNLNIEEWNKILFEHIFANGAPARIGRLRKNWKERYKIDIDSTVHPTLFRIIGSYLDQGISIWNFPGIQNGFLNSLREMERTSLSSFFNDERAKDLLLSGASLEDLLKIVVGTPEYYEQYLFDQQFAHPGWSGIVAIIEANPKTLLDTREITLEDLICLELLLEIDTLDQVYGSVWAPIGISYETKSKGVFEPIGDNTESITLSIFQEAYEWSYYEEVLNGILKREKFPEEHPSIPSFQGVFCIDDRECSIRRQLEKQDANCETYGTPGHFNVEFYFQPNNSKFYTKVCPAPITPKFIIQEKNDKKRERKDFHFSKFSLGLLSGFIMSFVYGFFSAFKMLFTIFRPMQSATFVTSMNHMDPSSTLTVLNENNAVTPEGLQIGFTVDEMATRLYDLLMSIGLNDHFASLVYFVGHGSSSSNNPYYTTMDCGACSCKPGSVNARVISWIANHPPVRKKLRERGLHIPDSTQFIGALHDTGRDEIAYYIDVALTVENLEKHKEVTQTFNKALMLNAKERSRRFFSIDTSKSAEKIHKQVKFRTVSLFETRPELDHATATLCIVGRRDLTRGLFLDRRAFLNSYNYQLDSDGKFLQGILNAASPVCGGINLNYYFSKVDNQNFGAGTKLAHNVIGLYGVSNGIDGDLRFGLPKQMIELHDPLRLLMIVEHFPEVVLNTIKANPCTYEWYENNWIHLVVFHPEEHRFYRFNEGQFSHLELTELEIPVIADLTAVIEKTDKNLPVYILK